MVSSEDYVPDENKRLFQPNTDELDNFYKRKSQLADNDLYLKIKLQEDYIQNQSKKTKNQEKEIQFKIIGPKEQENQRVQEKQNILKERKIMAIQTSRS